MLFGEESGVLMSYIGEPNIPAFDDDSASPTLAFGPFQEDLPKTGAGALEPRMHTRWSRRQYSHYNRCVTEFEQAVNLTNRVVGWTTVQELRYQ